MGKSIKESFRIPSLRATLHFLVVQVITQLGWNWVSKQFENKMIRELGFLALFVTGLIVVAWYLPKISPVLSGANKSIKKIAKLESAWLEQIQDDKDNLGKRLYGRDYVWSFGGLKNVDSFIEMTMTLINACVFPILVKGVNGRFLIEGQECAHVAEMEGQTRIPHGESGGIRIKQRLSESMMNLIAPKLSLRISLGSCQLVVQPEITGQQSQSSHIGLSIDQDVPIPKLE